MILVRPELPDEVVYRLAHAIHRGEGALAKRLQQGRYTTARNTSTQVPAERLHRGTARCYREARFRTVKGRKSNRIGTDMPSPTAIPAEGIGCIRRTDFQGGDAATLYRSIHAKLFSLPGETLGYPAHDYEGRRVSSIAQEKQRNPRLGSGTPLKVFVDIMEGMDLPYPKLIDYALPGNRACGMCPDDTPEHLQEYCDWISNSRQG